MVCMPKCIPTVGWVIIAGWALNVTTLALGQDDPAPDRADRGYLTANGFLNRGLYELAITEYRTFLSEHADHVKTPMARYGLAVCLFRTDRIDDAVGELKPLSKRDDFAFAAEVAMILGRCHLQKQRFIEAASAFKRVANKHTKHDLADDAAVGAAEALYHAGNYDKAVKWSDRLAKRWSNSPHRARAAFFGGLAEMATESFASAAKRFAYVLEQDGDGDFADQSRILLAQCHERNHSIDKAIRQYTKVLKAGTERFVSEALLALGHLFRRQGDLERSASVLDRLIERFADSAQIIHARFLRGRAHFDQAEYGKAFTAFAIVEKADGEIAASYQDQVAYWMAKCQLRQGSPKEAAERLTKAIERFEQSALLAEMVYDLGVARLRIDAVADAIAEWKTFCERFPEHELVPEALYLLAVTEHQREAYDASAAHGGTFLELYGDHARTSAVMMVMGENAFLSDDFERAVDAYQALLDRFPDDPQADQATLRLGTALFRVDRFDDARTTLEEVARRRGSDDAFASAHRLLGDIDFQRGEWKTAQRYYQNYVEGNSDRPGADTVLLKLGLSHQRQEQPAAAIEVFDRLIEKYPHSPHRLHAAFERGQSLVMLDRLDDARAAFELVVAENTDSRFAAHAFNHLASIASRQGRLDEAKHHLKRVTETTQDKSMQADALHRQVSTLMAANEFEEAQSTAEQFLSRFASHAKAKSVRVQRAIALARQDRFEDAVAAFDHIEQSGGPVLDGAQQSALTYEKAWCLKSLGRTDEAAKVYRSMIRDDATGDYVQHAMLELGGIEADAGRYEAASAVLRKVHRSLAADSSTDSPSPLLEQATYRLGVCEFELGRFDDSAALFEELITAFPSSSLVASASFHAGEARFKTGRFGEAAKHLNRVVERFEDDAVFEPGLLRLGDCLVSLQSWPAAEQAFAKYLNRFGNREQWFQAQFGVGFARENQRRFDEAISAYRDVVSRHNGPTAARAQFQIGESLFAQERFTDAVRELLRVDILYAYPQWSAAALYEAARCFEKLNKIAEARDHFGKVAENYGDSQWGQLATQRLSELSSATVPGR